MKSDDIMMPVCIKMRRGFLAATLHKPYGSVPRYGFPAVLLCHGFTGNRMEPHYIFVKMSRALSANGIASLRFDFRGCGESSGRFQDLSILTELEDALSAWKFMRKINWVDSHRCAVLGLSLGGAIAGLLAGKLANKKENLPAGVVLWNAVSDPASSWKSRLQKLRSQYGRQLKIPLEHHGNLIGKKFFRDVLRIPKPTDALALSGVPVLIIGSDTEAEHARAYANACVHQKAKLIILEGYDHTFARSDWEKKVIGITKRWFVQHLHTPVAL